jgi:hypothetical protein
MSGFFSRLKGFYGRLRQGDKPGVLLPAWRSITGETPTVSFQTLVKVYLQDPAARAAVDFLADQTVGMGFYTTAEVPRAKAVVDEFNESVNLDGLLIRATREIVAFGNSFMGKIEPDRLENLRILPITSIERILPDRYGEVQGYKQALRYGGSNLDPDRIIHFRWNPVDSEAFGTGMLHSLTESMNLGNGEKRLSFIAMKGGMEKGMTETVKKYAGPTEIWKFPGLADDKASEYASLIKNMPREGARFVVNVPSEIEVVTVDPRSRFEAYVEHIWNQFILGLQTPLPKLFTTPGFTEASARAAIEVAERRVMALQRFIKRTIEREIFTPVIEQVGLDPAKAGCRLNWGMAEKPEVVVADVLRAFELGAVGSEELRKMLKRAGWELWGG